MSEKKDTNPKDIIGSLKAGTSAIPTEAVYELGLAMLDGACKYGRHNFRAIGVRSSVYIDAAKRHLDAWWEGEEHAPEGTHHLGNAMACCAILLDALYHENLNDDRPPSLKPGWLKDLHERAKAIIDRYPDPVEPYTKGNYEWGSVAKKLEGVNIPQAVVREILGTHPVALVCEHEWHRAEGKTAYTCKHCGVVPTLQSTECEHDWMNYVIPGEAPMQHCRKCSAKRLLQKSDGDQ